MTRQADFVEHLRRDAWAKGRALQDSLLEEFCRRYGYAEPPAPALIVDELITDFLGADLRYDPLDLNVFARTECRDGVLVVTINRRIPEMEGVVDYEGEANVAKWHEIIHLVEDGPVLRARQPLPLEGFETPPAIVCYRSGVAERPGQEERRREFIAEEAGRAAAVSHRALARSPAFQRLAGLGGPTGVAGWRLLAEAARDIGVNRTALARQLQLEGRVVVRQEGGRNILYVQEGLL